MRIFCLIVLAALAILPAPARAECSANAQLDLCTVSNGHYRVRTPKTGGPYPVLLYLYGSGGRSNNYVESRRFQDEIVGRGYALLVPAALSMEFNDAQKGRHTDSGWNLRSPFYRTGRDDIKFLREVISDAETRFNINPRDILFVGQSHGGFFIWDIACHTPGLGKAFAIHGAGHGAKLPERCQRPVRFLQTHGVRDNIVPLEGERRQGRKVMFADQARSRALLARTNQCASGPVDAGVHRSYRHYAWEGCARGSSLDFLVHQGGHGYPRDWITTVMDWYEGGIKAEAADTAATPAATTPSRPARPAPSIARPKFKSAGQAGGSRFKKAPGTQ